MTTRPADLGDCAIAALGPQEKIIAEAADARFGMLSSEDIFDAWDRGVLVISSTLTEPVGQPTTTMDWDETVFANSDIIRNPTVDSQIILPQTSARHFYYVGVTLSAESITTPFTDFKILIGHLANDPLTGATILRSFQRLITFRNAVNAEALLWHETGLYSHGGAIFVQTSWSSTQGSGNINVTPQRLWVMRLKDEAAGGSA